MNRRGRARVTPQVWLAGVLVVLLSTAAAPAWARVVEDTGQEIAIRVARGHTTEVVFSEGIHQVVTSLGKDALSLETAGGRLYLSPLVDEVQGTVFVVLESERSIPLALVPATAAGPQDVSVRVLSPAREAGAAPAPPDALTPLGLLRRMVLRQEIPGVQVAAGGAREVYNDQAVRLTLAEVWRASQLEGDVLVAENLRTIWIQLPIERIHFPGLLAIHAEAEVLAPHPTTAEERLAQRHRTRLFLIRVP